MTDRQDAEEQVELDPKLEALARDLAAAERNPPRDLWPAIERRLPRRSRSRNVRWAALAAGVLALLALGRWRLASPPPSHDLRPPTRVDLARLSHDTSFQAEIAGAREEGRRLRARISRALDRYPAELGNDVQRSLISIDEALEELERSLAALPGEGDLEVRLAALYSHHVRVLRTLDGRLRGRQPGEEHS